MRGGGSGVGGAGGGGGGGGGGGSRQGGWGKVILCSHSNDQPSCQKKQNVVVSYAHCYKQPYC